MQINLVEDGLARRLNYDAANFDFGGVAMHTAADQSRFFRFSRPARGDRGGLARTRHLPRRELLPLDRPAARASASTARGLSIRTGDPRGEEFPIFRAVWIERPTLAANALTIHALLDSESVTGAYRFTLHPGEATIIDTECSLFAARDAR